jgi:signal transduction histidine kinase/CheY-like chemotaxis protein
MFFTPEDRAINKPQTALATAAETGRWEDEAWRVRKDGSRFWALAVLDPIRDSSGTLIGFAKITRDMTERRALEQAREQLHQAQKLETVGQLTGGIAHDFNNLLTAVSGSLSILQGLVSDPRAKRLIDTAEGAIARGSKLVQQLLTFARQHQLDPEPSNLNELIRSFEVLLRQAAGASRSTLTLDFFPGLWLANVDQTQFQSALLNLVINARDAMERNGGTITIATQNCDIDDARAKALGEIDAGPYVMVAVRDSGSGMTAETRARAIEPFYTTKATGRGSGLGLSQVYGFVRASNGQIEIDSEPGHGTTVRLFLPRLGRAHARDKEPVAVLVVEDDPLVLNVAVEGLRLAGYEVHSAASAAEALAILKQKITIHVLFSDIVMPEMNGVELAREARRLRPDLRVLLSSGYSREMRKAQKEGDFIPKPYRVPDLLDRIHHMTGNEVAAERQNGTQGAPSS